MAWGEESLAPQSVEPELTLSVLVGSLRIKVPISRLENGPDFLPQHEGLVSGNLLGIINPI
jgi:hypothetical protein